MFNIRAIILMTLFCFFLNACTTTTHRKDGPPPFPVDETKIPDAVPKVEARSKYGNYRSYIVFGKRYYVMASSKNYEEVGTASWYGTKFHKRRTSSGERYDMLAMTAAHKTLPLPTYAQVTNLRNGRTVIVKVNDRGPFEGTRLMDLSYVAAKKLGMIGHGTTKVRIRAIDPVEYAHRNDPRHFFAKHTKACRAPVFVANHKIIYLQVGAFQSRSRAEQLKKRVVAVVSSPVHIALQRKLYRVQIGPILDLVKADQISSQLQRHGMRTSKVM
jgi:rare lipoprotein A